MNRLSREDRAQILLLQMEGNSVRATSRITGRRKKTITKLMVDAGKACAAEHGRLVRGLTVRRIEADELWAFCAMKDGNVPDERRGEFGIGDVWTFTAIDPDTKLLVTWLIGRRDAETAKRFLVDLGRRIEGRFQLTTDGAGFYSEAVPEALGLSVDYAQLVKMFGASEVGHSSLGPRVVVGTSQRPVIGHPDPEYIGTSFVERMNLTIRMSLRRYTRKTNAFSKNLYNHSCAVAVMFFYYNYVRPHMTLTERAHGRPTTPAMAARLENRPWAMTDIVKLIEAREKSAVQVWHESRYRNR